jgi:glycosyltransferase involved in cell wall biosynthesis
MRLLFFDLNPSGHHAGYLHHLMLNKPSAESIAAVSMVVSPDFLTQHAGIVADAEKNGIRVVTISAEENAQRLARKAGLAQARAEWHLLVKYARQEQADEVLLMYFDHLQPAFFLSKPLPFDVSGILFRPSFHYADWGQGPKTIREQLQSFRKKWLLRALLVRPELKNLFSLDPFAVQPINQWARRSVAHYLPDPVATRNVSALKISELRQDLDIEPSRRVALVFGLLDERKGIEPLMQAFAKMSAKEQANWCVLLVGPLTEQMRAVIDTVLPTLTNVQVIRRHEFVADEVIQPFFAVADVVTVLYQQHVGMSAVLVRASAAGRPVLASGYGLVGQLVKTKQLGRIVDATNIDAIAEALLAFGQGAWTANANEMRNFANQNRAENFASTIFNQLIGKPLAEKMQEEL